VDTITTICKADYNRDQISAWTNLGESEYSVEKKDKEIVEIQINSFPWPSKVTKTPLTLELTPLDDSKIELYRIK